jgi:hypothetical protein
MATNNQETTPSEMSFSASNTTTPCSYDPLADSSFSDSDTSGGIVLSQNSKAEQELRMMKIKYLELEGDLIRGEAATKEGFNTRGKEGGSEKLTELKFMVCSPLPLFYLVFGRYVPQQLSIPWGHKNIPPPIPFPSTKSQD